MRTLHLPLFLGTLLAADATARPLAIGEVLADFTLEDADGREFTLAKARAIDDAAAHAAVVAAAKAHGGTDALAADAKLDALPGVKKGDGVDAAARLALVRAAGRPFGLVPSEKAAAALTTVGDVERWIRASANAPIAFVFWSPTCPYVKEFRERIRALAEETGVRIHPVCANHDETVAAIKEDADASGYRILVDPDARLADALGAKRTPHAFVIDEHNALRYAGTVDNDIHLQAEPSARIPWLRDAIAALQAGKAVRVLMTETAGSG
jgi:peroxiredoxin